MNSTIIIALIVVGSVALIVCLLVYVNNRDRKRESGN
jgi:hypothetical protein